MTDASPAPEPEALGPAVPVPDAVDEPVRRAARATRDAGLGYGLAVGRAGLRAAIGLGKAGADVALKVLDQSPVGDAAGSLADRFGAAAGRGRRPRAGAGAGVGGVVGRVVDNVVQVLDVDGIIRQVDVDDIVRRVDVDDIVGRVDIDDIISRVDVDGIVRRTEVGTLIVQSTGGIVTQVLDFVRSLGVSLDTVAERVVDRILHHGRLRPVAPVLLGRPAVDTTDPAPTLDLTTGGDA